MFEFKDRLRTAIKNSGLKQTEIVERTGISKSSLSEYLSGKYLAKQDNIYKLAFVLNVNEAWLMGYDVPKERIQTKEENKNKAAKLAGKILASKDEKKIQLTLDILEKVTSMETEQLEALTVLLRTIK